MIIVLTTLIIISLLVVYLQERELIRLRKTNIWVVWQIFTLKRANGTTDINDRLYVINAKSGYEAIGKFTELTKDIQYDSKGQVNCVEFKYFSIK